MLAIHAAVDSFVAHNAVDCVVTRDFTTVLITSDVHADLRKLVQMLIAAGLVARTGGPEPPGAYEIWSLEWVAEDTLLVITGDLVDGQRDIWSVDDPIGAYEMLLHVLLFNLRIGARARGSELLFTIGNRSPPAA